MDLFIKYERLLKVLGQANRLRIVKCLAVRDLCVCELETVLGMNQPSISQHLRALKDAGLVRERREGQWVFHSLDREALVAASMGLKTILETSPDELEGFRREAAALSRLAQDPIVSCRECEGKKRGR
ncbi:MAG: metalloregulator ArsR/SmtB family transcription factor [Bacillota bacterium]